MSAFAEKLKSAGVDTVGARLVAECTQAVRVYQDPWKAWQHVGSVFGHDFVRSLMADMQNTPAVNREAITAAPALAARKLERSDPYGPPQTPVVAPPVSPYKPRAPIPEVVALVDRVRSKYLSSDGKLWGDMSWQEIMSRKRDGGEAAALLEALPGDIPNDGSTPHDTLGGKRVNEIIAKARHPNL